MITIVRTEDTLSLVERVGCHARAVCDHSLASRRQAASCFFFILRFSSGPFLLVTLLSPDCMPFWDFFIEKDKPTWHDPATYGMKHRIRTHQLAFGVPIRATGSSSAAIGVSISSSRSDYIQWGSVNPNPWVSVARSTARAH